MNIQDPYGLVEQMFPRFWGPEKRKEVKDLPRIQQIQEVQRYKQQEGSYEEFSVEKLERVMDDLSKGGVLHLIAKTGENWYRVRVGKHSFYTNEVGLKELEDAMKEGGRR